MCPYYPPGTVPCSRDKVMIKDKGFCPLRLYFLGAVENNIQYMNKFDDFRFC